MKNSKRRNEPHSDMRKSHKKHLSDKEKPAEKKNRLVGIIRTTGKGLGFVAVPGYEKEIVIQPEFVNTALNNDEVEIIVTGKHFDMKRGRPGRRTSSEEGGFDQFSGQVIKILKRAKRSFVGVFKIENGIHMVSTDDRKMYADITIPTDKTAGAKEGQKVLTRILHWDQFKPNPEGEIVQILGDKGNHEAEIQSIILDRGIDTNFPPEVAREAEEIGRSGKPLDPDEIATRRDFRGTLTFTIDPVDAKDFDDALSFKKLTTPHPLLAVPVGRQGKGGEELYEIGVHIADVSHYVRENTALDREARNRSFSVYLVDRTIPMLPEVLSNDLCSLNPNEDRFAFSAVFVMNAQAHVLERWFGKTVIYSNKRFSYESAQDVINKKTGDFHAELNTLDEIAKKLKVENYKKGAIDFATEEVKFKLDENGKPLGVYKKERLDTHKLIEEFMLLANREVAEFISKTHKNASDRASIYRIHNLPDTERIEELALFLQALGYHLPVRQGKVTSQDINKLLETIADKPEESLIKTATLRSMAKAIYSTNNIGHFGLGFEYYTHFTSPIRRYPDLMVHRILQGVLTGDKKKVRDEFSLFEKISNHATEKEIAAAEAERASIKYKQVEYMSEHIGEEFDGVISGVTEWGMFIEEINTKCEGLVPLRELTDDFYIFNRKTYSVEGERTKKKYRLGDKVRFKVIRADLDAKTLDYNLISPLRPPHRT